MDDESAYLPFRMLVVDEEDTARSVRRILQPNDVVVRAATADDACNRIANSDADAAPFDVVLCRIDIDESDGEKILRAVRAYAEPPMFIYLATHAQDPEQFHRAADGILIKPFRYFELEDLMLKIVTKRSRDRLRRMLSDSN